MLVHIYKLLKVYQARIRSTLEFDAPVFHGSLTKEQSRVIEMVQKKAFAVTLGREYNNYQHALITLKQQRFDNRRENLSYNFAIKAITYETLEKHKILFL